MKCSSCYADNDAWVTVCIMCGDPVVPVELCDNGHILPPGARECPLCPSMWPDVSTFSGPGVLRGILLVERGRLENEAGAPAEFLEIRDHEQPLSFVQAEPGRLSPTTLDDGAATVRILMRPDGVSTCVKPGKGKLAYEKLPPGGTRAVGGVQFRSILFDVPKDFGEAPVTTTRSGRKKKASG